MITTTFLHSFLFAIVFMGQSVFANRWIDLMKAPSAHFYEVQEEANAYFEVNETAEVAPPVADFTSDVQQSCDGIIKFKDLSDNNPTSWSWNFGDGLTAISQNPSHTYTSNGTYTIKLTATNGAGSNVKTKTAYITVTIPPDPSTQNAKRCGPGIITLTASGSNTLYWYTSSTGGVPVNTGNTYSPDLTGTTDFYVENSTMGTLTNVGPADTTTLNNGRYYVSPDVYGLFFNVLTPCNIRSVKVYANTAANRTFEVLSSTGTVIKTKKVFVPIGESRVTLDFNLPAANQYFMKITGTINLYRSTIGASYPYLIPGLISITGTNVSASNPGYYYFFYDWQVQSEGCASKRTIVTGSVLDCTGINDITLTEGVTISPNPTNGIVQLMVNNASREEYKIAIKNALGQLVYQKTVYDPLDNVIAPIDLSPFGKGIYMVSLTNSYKEFVKKIIVY